VKRLFLVLAAMILLAGSANADMVFMEDFEDAIVSYTTSIEEFTDGGGDFFIRTDGSDYGSFVSYANVQGSSYFAAMDIDGEGASLPAIMSFTGIDISGYSNLTFSALFAEDDDGTNEDWDRSDYVKIEYQIDGGGYQNLLAFENDGSTYNTQAYQDTDFDTVGDGIALTDTFALFAEDIGETGANLDLRITFDLNAGDEDIAIDNVMITGDANAVPVPNAIILLGCGLIGLAGIKRQIR
jgi:hypothetical protein